jgi:hypothetical protein
MRSEVGRPTCLLTSTAGKLAGRLSRILSRGNDKIGATIFAFNLAAVRTCPGMSAACRAEWNEQP